MALLLRPGDCLLYRATGLFGTIIGIKTWHNIAHVEVYDGCRESWASRDGLGVNNYPVRTSDLAYVLRPCPPLNLSAARQWATDMRGVPYGWIDLLNFIGININRRGIVCSPFAAQFYRQAGWNVFPEDPVNKIAPFQFLDLVGDGMTVAYSFVHEKTPRFR